MGSFESPTFLQRLQKRYFGCFSFVYQTPSLSPLAFMSLVFTYRNPAVQFGSFTSKYSGGKTAIFYVLLGIYWLMPFSLSKHRHSLQRDFC